MCSRKKFTFESKVIFGVVKKHSNVPIHASKCILIKFLFRFGYLPKTVIYILYIFFYFLV